MLTKLKAYLAAGFASAFALLYAWARWERGKRVAAEAREATTEARSSHRVAMAEADREGAENAAEKVEKAVQNAKTDNDWSRLRRP